MIAISIFLGDCPLGSAIAACKSMLIAGPSDQKAVLTIHQFGKPSGTRFTFYMDKSGNILESMESWDYDTDDGTN
jgi:hypothetical protein